MYSCGIFSLRPGYLGKNTLTMKNLNNTKRYIKLPVLALALCVISQPAWANMGVPMIFITLPMMLLGLLPIIAIEGFVLKKQLPLPTKKAFTSAAISNIFSTLIGVPLTWGALLLIQIMTGGGTSHGIGTLFEKFLAVTWQAPWLIPYEKDLHWMVPTAMLFLLIPFFFVSWKTESFITAKLNKDTDPQKIKSAYLKANAITYALLTLFPIGMFLFG